jgi:hypothetical protein
MCSQLRCAVACLVRQGCWYYKFDDSGSTACADCIFFDSSVTTWQATGTLDLNVYKWRG